MVIVAHRRTSLYACLRFLDGSKWCNKEHPYNPYIFVNCMTASCSIKCGLQYIRNYQLWKATSSILLYYMNYKENYLFWKRQRSTTFLVSVRLFCPVHVSGVSYCISEILYKQYIFYDCIIFASQSFFAVSLRKFFSSMQPFPHSPSRLG